MEQNREFTKFKYPIALNNSKVEGRIKFHFSGFPTSQPTDVKKVIYCADLILHLENTDGKQNDTASDIKEIKEMLKVLTAKK